MEKIKNKNIVKKPPFYNRLMKTSLNITDNEKNRLGSIITNIVQKNPLIAQAQPLTLFGGVMLAESAGLNYLSNDYYLVRYGTRAQLIISYMGLYRLITGKGNVNLKMLVIVPIPRGIKKYKTARGFVRRYIKNRQLADDSIEYNLANTEGYLGYAETIEGFQIAPCWMTTEQLQKYAIKYSTSLKNEFKNNNKWDDNYKSSKKDAFSPWINNFDIMAKKTILKKMLKWLPATSENFTRLINADQAVVTINDKGEYDIDYADNKGGYCESEFIHYNKLIRKVHFASSKDKAYVMEEGDKIMVNTIEKDEFYYCDKGGHKVIAI